MPKRYLPLEELEREKKMIQVDLDIEETILKLQSSGKKIILISDTYYSATNLRYLLNSARFNLDLIEIFSSCEYGMSKCNGLFTVVKNSLSLEYGAWIHIGDNLNADHSAPQALGITSLIYTNHVNWFLKSNILSRRGMSKLMKFKGPLFFYNLSRVIHGIQKVSATDLLDVVSTVFVRPIVTHSIVAIEKSEKDRGSELLLYCSRDGWLFFNAHLAHKQRHFSKLEIGYFKTSRTLRNQPRYLSYVDKITKDKRVVGVFDLGWKGSTLKFLEATNPEISWKGYFLTSTYSGDSENKNLADFTLLEKINVLRAREFLELMFPAPSASFSEVDSGGNPVTVGNGINSKQMDANRICFNVLDRKIDFHELEFTEALMMIYLLAVYPGSGWIEEMSAFHFDSSGEDLVPLVTSTWSTLLSRNKILWPFSARSKYLAPMSLVFKLLCVVKEFCQKIPLIKRGFIG
jgi:hypothetical protein